MGDVLPQAVHDGLERLPLNIWLGWPPMTRLLSMQLAGVLVSALSFVGCSPQAPIPALPVCGAVIDGGLFPRKFTLQRDDRPPKAWQLSERQLSELHPWMKAHHADLHMVPDSPPPPSFSVVTSDADGNRTQMDLFSANESRRRAVHVIVTHNDGNPAYGGEMLLAPDGAASLRRILAERA